jgi:hypothetical protein
MIFSFALHLLAFRPGLHYNFAGLEIPREIEEVFRRAFPNSG